MPSKVPTTGSDLTVDELRRELAAAREQQAATADILKVISSSPNDLQQVIGSVAKNAASVCNATDAHIYSVEGDRLRFVAGYGSVGVTSAARTEGLPVTRGTVTGRAFLDRRTVHIPDLAASLETDFPDSKPYQRELGFRTTLATPLLSKGTSIGAILIRRMAVDPFTDEQIGMLETFADQAVIAIENARLFEAEQARKRELQESLEYQTATSDVLSVISRSPSDLQPVLNTLVASAARLCDAEMVAIHIRHDDAFPGRARYGVPAEMVEALSRIGQVMGRGSLVGRTIAEGRPVHIPDAAADLEYTNRDFTRITGARSMLGVPLLRDGGTVGLLSLYRTRVSPFTERQIELMATFADQAVIAIENTRLFEEVQARTRELQQSLEYQTAMSDVLGVISSSPDRLQPVLDAIVSTAQRLCTSDRAYFNVLQSGRYHLMASTEGIPQHIVDDVRAKPVVAGRGSHAERALLERKPIHIEDTRLDPEFTLYDVNEPGRARTLLGVPLLRGADVIGLITLARVAPKPFTPRQIDLIATFASQAVIAINNVDLFDEVQSRTRELTESLEYQTATSEVLNVISQSKFDLQPVVDTIVETAVRLCRAERGALMRFEQGGFRLLPSSRGNLSGPVTQALVDKLIPVDRGSMAGRVALEGRTVHVRDLQADPEFTFLRGTVGDNRRTCVGVPLIGSNGLLGAIILQRTEVLPFTDKQIELVETFAAQAVIAFENTRLFEEAQARNRDLTALGEVGRAVSSTLDLKVVLKAVVDRAVELSGTDAGSIFYLHPNVGTFELGETTGLDADVVAKLRKLDISATETGLGEAIANRQPLQAPDVTKRASNPLRDAALDAGLRAALIVPLLGSEGPLGALVLQRRRPGEFPSTVVSLMQSFADQSAIALENARLFEEIAQKSRELEIASQHKSQFVANMSHELRTPLAAILGYAELMQEGFYEPQGPKSLDALTRIRSNGRHLLGLINTVLDIAKIESGQFNLNLGEYALENVVETVHAATEALAETKKLGLKTDVAKPLPIGVGDEQRLTQVLLNLVGNAIKFTDKGEVRISAAVTNSHFAVSVTDTGPGIPLEEQKRIFEQFHQVDSSNTKAKGGTGLGLAIAKQIVEMHGGRIWVESTVGKGSRFQIEIPTHAEFREHAI